MIIFLYGSDGYRIKENIDSVAGSYRKKHKSGVNYYRLDLSENTGFDPALASKGGAGDLFSAIRSVSFFDEIKLIVIRSVFSSKTYSQKLIALINDLDLANDKNTVLLFAENKSKKELQKADKELFSILNHKKNIVKEIEPLSGVKLSNWVKNKFKENGQNVSPAVVGSLIGTVGSESWALANEMNKLCNYLTGKTCHDRSCLLTKEDVDLLVGRKEINSIFELTDAVGSQNKAKAFEMMYRLTNSGQDPHYLLSMLVYHFENLLSVSDLLSRRSSSGNEDLASKCGLHPFVAKKAAAQARKFPEGLLLEKFNYLAELDIASKNGAVNLEDALYNFTVL